MINNITKLWQKEFDIDKAVEVFSIGQDKVLDLKLAYWDVIGSKAHIKMLAETELISPSEYLEIDNELNKVLQKIKENKFVIEDGVEDVHSQIELMLIQSIGKTGKKIHTARSRNDQVLLDLKLFFRSEIQQIALQIEELFKTLQDLSEKHKEVLMPGYTHMQAAMVSSFGLWFGAFAESLIEDLHLLLSAYNVSNQNPLGSAAGYGSSLPIDRTMTTELLGFDHLNFNVVHAQLGRGKTELIISFAMASIAQTIGKLATDICLYMNPAFGFIGLPDQFTTGSSIMPHKKNPDVFELVRGKSNQILNLPNSVTLLISNLPNGYHRDFQLLKETVFPAVEQLKSVLDITIYGLKHIKVNTGSLDVDQHQLLFTVEAVNELVLEGVPFRTAYEKVAVQVEEGTFNYNKQIKHSHEGSLGNLCTEQIRQKFNNVFDKFNFKKAEKAINALLSEG